MPFVNEYIPAEDFEKYGLHEIDKRQASAVRARDWTVDRERGIYLRELNRGREEFSYESYWTFFWRGSAYTIELHAIEGGGRPGAPGWAKWGLVRVNGQDAPAGLPQPAEEFLADLHDALLAYKDGGWFAQCTDFEVELGYKVWKQEGGMDAVAVELTVE